MTSFGSMFCDSLTAVSTAIKADGCEISITSFDVSRQPGDSLHNYAKDTQRHNAVRSLDFCGSNREQTVQSFSSQRLLLQGLGI